MVENDDIWNMFGERKKTGNPRFSGEDL